MATATALQYSFKPHKVGRSGRSMPGKARNSTVFSRFGTLSATGACIKDRVFLDPAAGSGNFLTETYISLRRLENEALFAETGRQMMLGMDNIIQVSIGQFYGIEINDFAVTVAKTALWIAESQMLQETEQLMQVRLDFLPLKSYANIVEGNALRLKWENVVPKEKLSYIMGNPPFVGYAYQTKEQKYDLANATKNAGKNLDYVSGWYYLASELMQDTTIRIWTQSQARKILGL